MISFFAAPAYQFQYPEDEQNSSSNVVPFPKTLRDDRDNVDFNENQAAQSAVGACEIIRPFAIPQPPSFLIRFKNAAQATTLAQGGRKAKAWLQTSGLDVAKNVGIPLALGFGVRHALMPLFVTSGAVAGLTGGLEMDAFVVGTVAVGAAAAVTVGLAQEYLRKDFREINVGKAIGSSLYKYVTSPWTGIKTVAKVFKKAKDIITKPPQTEKERKRQVWARVGLAAVTVVGTLASAYIFRDQLADVATSVADHVSSAAHSVREEAKALYTSVSDHMNSAPDPVQHVVMKPIPAREILHPIHKPDLAPVYHVGGDIGADPTRIVADEKAGFDVVVPQIPLPRGLSSVISEEAFHALPKNLQEQALTLGRHSRNTIQWMKDAADASYKVGSQKDGAKILLAAAQKVYQGGLLDSRVGKDVLSNTAYALSGHGAKRDLVKASVLAMMSDDQRFSIKFLRHMSANHSDLLAQAKEQYFAMGFGEGSVEPKLEAVEGGLRKTWREIKEMGLQNRPEVQATFRKVAPALG